MEKNRSNKNSVFLPTFDVEDFSIPQNTYDPEYIDHVCDEGLEPLLSRLKKMDIKGTFFITGEFIEKRPDAISMIEGSGHEVGCHGYTHDLSFAFDILSPKKQKEHLKKARRGFEKYMTSELTSFRAPALRTGPGLPAVLIEEGFKIDSSVCPQRFDGPLTTGARGKFKWLFNPRGPYLTSKNDVFKRGNGPLLEVPVSAFLLAYIGSTMRVAPSLVKGLSRVLNYESKKTGHPMVFLFHPNECVPYDKEEVSTTNDGPLLSRSIRHKLKMRNLGKPSLDLLEEIIKYHLDRGAKTMTMSEYRRKYWGEKRGN